MHDVVRRSALPGRPQSSHDKVARGLGYFSIRNDCAGRDLPGSRRKRS
jgi:hypothetical protein